MRASGRIESLSYSTIYLTGAFVAFLLSVSQNNPLIRILVHAACSWAYVVYWVLHFQG